jgi:hypothetical protein
LQVSVRGGQRGRPQQPAGTQQLDDVAIGLRAQMQLQRGRRGIGEIGSVHDAAPGRLPGSSRCCNEERRTGNEQIERYSGHAVTLRRLHATCNTMNIVVEKRRAA